MPTTQHICLVSSCLLGLCTRYDGEIKQYPLALQELESYLYLPVCPEQLGGLPTPRQAADIHGGDGHDVLAQKATVLCKDGSDVTSEFIKGAQQVLQIAKMQNVTKAVLKARSPSCAVTGNPGVTAALLQQHGIETIEIE